MTGMRLAKTLALTALVMITVPVLSPAQTPADPLVRPDETPGKYELTLGLAYVPGGEESLALSRARSGRLHEPPAPSRGTARPAILRLAFLIHRAHAYAPHRAYRSG